ncbi:MAG: deoxyribodipyrimidine photo-lyase, partial [Bacteroidota bacterium]
MLNKEKNIGLVWFRNDLRVDDNYVLNQASKKHESIIAVYCLDPRYFEVDRFGFKKTEKFRAKFLLESVIDLKENLKGLNIELFIYIDYPEEIIPDLVKKFEVENLYFQKEWTQEERS